MPWIRKSGLSAPLKLYYSLLLFLISDWFPVHSKTVKWISFHQSRKTDELREFGSSRHWIPMHTQTCSPQLDCCILSARLSGLTVGFSKLASVRWGDSRNHRSSPQRMTSAKLKQSVAHSKAILLEPQALSSLGLPALQESKAGIIPSPCY